jgi:hypothetical protein
VSGEHRVRTSAIAAGTMVRRLRELLSHVPVMAPYAVPRCLGAMMKGSRGQMEAANME